MKNIWHWILVLSFFKLCFLEILWRFPPPHQYILLYFRRENIPIVIDIMVLNRYLLNSFNLVQYHYMLIFMVLNRVERISSNKMLQSASSQLSTSLSPWTLSISPFRPQKQCGSAARGNKTRKKPSTLSLPCTHQVVQWKLRLNVKLI